ncbi:hypothetical protein FZO89_04995 [Luteimonas viscosa]|uniref:Lipoprotein n=1 Tax=Luteimonas viscosa TaxID=1132694 RepID=A0A5D4XP01_9GAMM|nr:hypothetical protein [Luteimonas viscosa]TYT25663.1 hypothetical protein FZO89_04995 [Luteimonas viscosa]
MAMIQHIRKRIALAGLLAAVCASCEAAGDVSAATDAPPAADASVVDELPLRRGYYVADDTPCDEASNATLHLMRRDGDGYAGYTTPPYFCRFMRIERTGPSSYRVTEKCEHGYGDGGQGPAATVSSFEILSETRYRAKREDGWESSSSRCPRRQLPALWRDSDIGDFVD